MGGTNIIPTDNKARPILGMQIKAKEQDSDAGD